MQLLWSADELEGAVDAGSADFALLADLTGTGKLGMVAQLAFWRRHDRFPDAEAAIRATPPARTCWRDTLYERLAR